MASLVLDEVAQLRVFFLADRRLQADRLLADLEDLDAPSAGVMPISARDLLRGRLAVELGEELALHAEELADGLDHVHRDADGARLIGKAAGDRPGGSTRWRRC